MDEFIRLDSTVNCFIEKPVRWGALSSLYSQLSGRHVCALEQAIRERCLGNYNSARMHFDDLLPLAETTLIIAIERAITFDVMGWNLHALNELRTALDTSMAKGGFENTAEHYLLRIYIAEIQMYAEGKCRAALDEARVIGKWLKDVPVEDYTDVMVCIWTLFGFGTNLSEQHRFPVCLCTTSSRGRAGLRQTG